MGEAPTQAEEFRTLPVGMLLTELVQSVRDEVVYKWSADDREAEYPILLQLWLYVLAATRSVLRDRPDDSWATELRKRWGELNDWYDEPLPRGWRLTSREAVERQNVLMEFLYDAGFLKFGVAEVDAPRSFLGKREAEGE
ncbi:MAG: hypothetical protein ACREC5_05565 [Thermoplasmata archaeon]